MIRALFVVSALSLNLVLQSTWFEYIAVLGIKPNTSLIFIVCYAMLRGDGEGAAAGFASGLLQDFMFGRIIGLYALLGMLTGYFCGKPFRDFYRESLILPLFMTAVSVMFYEFAFYFFSFLFRGNINLFFYFGRIIIPGMVYSALAAFPVYRLVYAANKGIETHERKAGMMFKGR